MGVALAGGRFVVEVVAVVPRWRWRWWPWVWRSGCAPWCHWRRGWALLVLTALAALVPMHALLLVLVPGPAPALALALELSAPHVVLTASSSWVALVPWMYIRFWPN